MRFTSSLFPFPALPLLFSMLGDTKAYRPVTPPAQSSKEGKDTMIAPTEREDIKGKKGLSRYAVGRHSG